MKLFASSSFFLSTRLVESIRFSSHFVCFVVVVVVVVVVGVVVLFLYVYFFETSL